jgi:hypothetical protein
LERSAWRGALMGQTKNDNLRRPERGRALFYTRDSGGHHEMTPGEYVEWTRRKCVELGLGFSGTTHQIKHMIAQRRSADGDIFLDFDIAGNILSRPGLDALLFAVENDKSVSHVFIPRPDRLARPDEILDGIKLEQRFRKELGVALVFNDRIAPAIPRGQKQPVTDLIFTALEYDAAEKFRRELAGKTLHAQTALAKAGFSTGGRASYGLCRWLVRDDGTPIRPLEDKEYVRTKGQHVRWLPGLPEEWQTRRRILDMVKTMPASEVARILTAEGIPSPDAGRTRTDGAHEHAVSGVWHQSTIINIARDPRNMSVHEYGRRCMGDRLRYSPTGPRELEEKDFGGRDKPRVIENPASERLRTAVPIESLMCAKEHGELIEILDRRAGSQKGKPRSRTPQQNPLGCRIFDMECGWPMYRVPYKDSFQYVCGLYQQSHAAECQHNHADGLTAVRFTLSCMRQKLFRPGLQGKLEARLRELAAQDRNNCNGDKAKKVTSALELVQTELRTVERNLAMARTPEQYQAVAKVFDQLLAKKSDLETQLAIQQRSRTDVSADDEVRAAMSVAERLIGLADDPANLGSIGHAFSMVNARLFLRFKDVQAGKRQLRKPAGGVITFGAAVPPIRLYEGPTGRKHLMKGVAIVGNSGIANTSARSVSRCLPGQEGHSLGNVNRGDRI